MSSPIELIGRTRRHRARIAAIGAGLNLVLPLAITIGLLFGFPYLREMAAKRWGYTLSSDRAADFHRILIAAVSVELAAIIAIAIRAYLGANDYIATAARIDEHVGAHQEILTLASMTDPSNPQERERRSPLFPMLWRRTIAYFDLFDPRREFRLQPLAPLRRSLIFAGVGLIALGFGVMAMVQPPSALDRISRTLRHLGEGLDNPGADTTTRNLAAAVRAVSDDLENPHLPPEQKQQELAALKQQVEKIQQQNQNGTNGHGAMPTGSGSGAGSGNSAGNAKGSGNGQGSGQGAKQNGPGEGQAGGSGPGKGAGGNNNAGNNQIVKLGNEIDKAQAQIAMNSGPPDKTQGSQQLAENGTGVAPKAGNNPNATGPESNPNASENAQLPKPGGRGGDSANRSAVPGPQANGASGRKDDVGSAGDTHLGEIPKPMTVTRFYAAGEGPKLDLQDARYTTFRLPTTIENNNAGGALVLDNGQAHATSPYTNAPLKQERIADTPDEQQLVPPRYRDLIH